MLLTMGGILALLGLIAGACLIRMHFLLVTVEHESMLPTLQHGDRVLALRRGFRRWIRRGSIVLVAHPDSDILPGPPDLYIKRVVALGGATITLPLSPQDAPVDAGEQPTPDEQAWQIPRHHLFVCGDNYASSIDSRQWGPIPLKNIRGLVLFKLRPAPAHAIPPQKSAPFFPPDKLQPGDLAPLFSIISQHGKTIALEDYRGQAVLLLFTTTGPLMYQHLPSYLSFAEHLEVLGACTLLVCDASEAQALELIEALEIRLPVLAVSRGRHPLFEAYGVSLTPAYCLIGADGRVLKSGLAVMGASFWRADILSHLTHRPSEVV